MRNGVCGGGGKERAQGPLHRTTETQRGQAQTWWPLGQGTQPCSPTANHILSRKGNWAGRGWSGERAAWPGTERGWAEAGRPLGRLALMASPQGALWRKGPRESWPDPAGYTPQGTWGCCSSWLEGPAYLESSYQHFQGALPIGLPRRGSLGPEEQQRRERLSFTGS